MSKFGVDVSQVSSASAVVRASVDTIRTDVSTMMRHLNDLQGSWTGSAAVAFAGVVAQWQATQVQVEAGLDSITTALDTSATAYAEVEALVRSQFA